MGANLGLCQTKITVMENEVMANEFKVKKGLDVQGNTVISGTLNTRDLTLDAGKLDSVSENADVTVDALTAGENIRISTAGVVDSISGTSEFIASGTLPNGAPVILKPDGTVEVVGLAPVAVEESIPEIFDTTFNSQSSFNSEVAFDPNTTGRFVVVYDDRESAQTSKAVVGTISESQITFGTESTFTFNSASKAVIAFDPNTADMFVIAYSDSSNANLGTAIVGTIAAEGLSFSGETTFSSTNVSDISIAFDPSVAKSFCIVCEDSSTSKGIAIVGTVSGESFAEIITFGTESIYNNSSSLQNKIDFNPYVAGQFIVIYSDVGNNDYGVLKVGTIGETAISFSAASSFNTTSSTTHGIGFDPDTTGKFIVAYRDNDNGQGTARVGTLAGNSVTLGTAYSFGVAESVSLAVTGGKFVVSFSDPTNGDNYLSVSVGTLNGDSISYGGSIVLSYSSFQNPSQISFDPNKSGNFVLVFRDESNSDHGKATTGQLAGFIQQTNLTLTNFLGMSTDAYTNGQTATIVLQGGVSTNQDGLTTDSTYYLQEDGTLSDTATTPVLAGRALSDTSLFIRDLVQVDASTLSGELPERVFPFVLPSLDGQNLYNLPIGGWSEIDTQTVIFSTVSSVAFEYLPEAYDEFRLVITGLVLSPLSPTTRYIGFSDLEEYSPNSATNWGDGLSFTEFNSAEQTPHNLWNDEDSSVDQWKIYWGMNGTHANPSTTDLNGLNGEYLISVKDSGRLTMYGHLNGKWETGNAGVLRSYGSIVSSTGNPLRSLSFHGNDSTSGTFALYGTTYS